MSQSQGEEAWMIVVIIFGVVIMFFAAISSFLGSCTGLFDQFREGILIFLELFGMFSLGTILLGGVLHYFFRGPVSYKATKAANSCLMFGAFCFFMYLVITAIDPIATPECAMTLSNRVSGWFSNLF